MGTYKTDVGSFVKAYVKQKEQMQELYGVEYEAPNEDTLMYLECQQVYMNNVLVSCFNHNEHQHVLIFFVSPQNDLFCLTVLS